MRLHSAVFFIALFTAACGGGGGGSTTPPGPTPTPSPTPTATPQALYEPLAVGDTWNYTCRDIKGGGENGGLPFSMTDSVVGTTTVGGVTVHEFALQVPLVPSNPVQIITQTQLLANDPSGNLSIYGYLVGNAVQTVTPTVIVAASAPAPGALFSYPGQGGGIVSRVFFGVVPTNPTPLGTFTVADYEESGATNDYGYAQGSGIMEEDHGPNFEVDCLISSFTVH